MARKRGKMALYEVMSKARAKPNYGKVAQPVQPEKKQLKVPPVTNVPVEAEPEPQPQAEVKTKWRLKPSFVQYNNGRIEFSVPYELVITVGLVLILILLLSYKFGQWSKKAGPAPEGPATLSQSSGQNPPAVQPRTENPPASPGNTDTTPAVGSGVATVGSSGSNVLVLKEYHAMADLVPAQSFFRQYGINTEIDRRNGVYFLQTLEKFDYDPSNPANADKEGYKLKQKIAELGKQYKAPDGYESFTFDDAYGYKIK